MKHLTDDQIYRLAVLTEEMEPYDSCEMEQMEHLKTCKECYDKFCAALSLVAVTSESGYMVLADIYETENLFEMEDVKEIEKICQTGTLPGSSKNEKILAAVKVVRQKVEETVSAVIEQIEEIESMFKFRPALAFSARSIKNVNAKDTDDEIPATVKVKNIEDEKTFIMFDAKNNQLMVQVNVKELESKEIAVYLDFGNHERQEVPLERRGNIVKGVVSDLPEADFSVYIEIL